MAAKGTKRGRGRTKATEPETEPETEPTTSPEAPLPPEDTGAGEGTGEPQPQASADETPPAQEPKGAGTESEPIGPPDPVEPRHTEAPATWSVSTLVVAGLTAVLVAAVVAVAVVYATAGDTIRLDQQAQRLDALVTQAQTQTSRLDAAEGTIEDLRSQVGQVTVAVGDLQATAEANSQNLEQISAAIEDLRGAVSVPADGVAGEAVAELQDTIRAVDERVASLEQSADLDDLTGRIARLEEEIAGIREQAAQRIEQAQAATALGRAYAALTQRIAAGDPFGEELAAVTAEMPDAPGLETLRPIADQGAPSVADLRARLHEIAAGLPDEESDDIAADDGVWQTMRERLEGMVTVRRADEADLSAALARADEALQRNDIDTAIAEVEQVSEAAPDGIEAWLADARARRDAEAGLNELSAAVLRQFARQ
jgi:hypothetical protein